MTSYLERFEQTPFAAQWPAVRQWMFDESFPLGKELRTYRPVLTTPAATVVSGFHLCREMLANNETFGVDLYKPKQGAYWMAQDNTAQHQREKSVMYALLDKEDIPAIRQYTADTAAAALHAAGGTIDAVNGLARAVALGIVRDKFGYDGADMKKLAAWSYINQADAFRNQPIDDNANADAITAEREQAKEELVAYLSALVGRRAGELKAGQQNNDMVSRLIKLSASGAVRFDIPAVVLNAGGLLIGTVETTAQAALHVLAELFSRPDILKNAKKAALSDNTDALDGYVFEALRFRPIAPYIIRKARRNGILARGTDHETAINEGDIVLAYIHAAMFDEEGFTRPDDFDPARPQENSFHFGYGPHVCLGAAIGMAVIPEIVRQCLRLENISEAAPMTYDALRYPERYMLRWKTGADAACGA